MPRQGWLLSQALGKWVCQAERDQGRRGGTTTSERERLNELERENRELKRANEILRKASAFFAQAELDRRPEVLVAFIDAHRGQLGVEPICRELPIAPSQYYIGWRVSRSMHTEFVLDALEQAVWSRSSTQGGWCITPITVAICRFATPSGWSEVGAQPSVGSVGDSYDNALAETVNGLYKTESH
jgi:transposase InsO family protein